MKNLVFSFFMAMLLFAGLSAFTDVEMAKDNIAHFDADNCGDIAPPSGHIVFACLKDSPTYRQEVLSIATQVAKDVHNANYSGTSTQEIKRTEFSNMVLKTKHLNDPNLSRVINYITSYDYIPDLNDPNAVLSYIRDALYTEWDRLAGVY